MGTRDALALTWHHQSVARDTFDRCWGRSESPAARLIRDQVAQGASSVHDEQLRADARRRSMRLAIVRDLKTHASSKDEGSAIVEFCEELALETQEDVAFRAPVIRYEARKALHHAHANGAALNGAPVRDARSTLLFGGLNGRPVGRSERNAGHVHSER